MDITHAIRIIAFSLLVILILTDYIVIKKPYNYITVLFIIFPAILIQTPIVKNMSKKLELIFVPLYFIISIIIMLFYMHKIKKEQQS